MRISLLIAAHNEGELLWRTVQSCNETCCGLDYEVVIADDASCDSSVEEVQRRFPRVRIVRHEQRQGASPAKDLAARSAQGDVLVFLDGHCNPEHGAILRLVESIEQLKGQAIVTPAIASLDVTHWKNTASQIGHGYFLDLDQFHCGWLPLSELRAVQNGSKKFYESPAVIGCAFAIARELYETLWGFDPHMRCWGVEDLDFSLKCWLMGFPILHDPEAVVGHRFRSSFDTFDVPPDQFVANQLRMARKNFTHGTWSDWADRCRLRHDGRLVDRPEGLWARSWFLFEELRASVEHERAYLMAHRVRDEFWYADRFGLTWPRLLAVGVAPVPQHPELLLMEADPSPSPPPCAIIRVNPGVALLCIDEDQEFTGIGVGLDDLVWTTDPTGSPVSGVGNPFTTKWTASGLKTLTASCTETSVDVPVTVVKVVSITVISGATQTNVTGDSNWAAVWDDTPGADVIIEVTLDPNTDAAAAVVTWTGGDPVTFPVNMPRQRKVSKGTSAKTTVNATCGSSSAELDVWILLATVTIQMAGTTPPNAVQFGNLLDQTENLGAVSYDGGAKAAGKDVAIGQLSPPGVHAVVDSGWTFKRDKWSHKFYDAVASVFDTNWNDDTSLPEFQILIPDSDDRIYDTDGPTIGLVVFNNCGEIYTNFRQWVEWNGQIAVMQFAYWSWKAKKKVGAMPEEVILKQLSGSLITLPDTAQGCN